MQSFVPRSSGRGALGARPWREPSGNTAGQTRVANQTSQGAQSRCPGDWLASIQQTPQWHPESAKLVLRGIVYELHGEKRDVIVEWIKSNFALLRSLIDAIPHHGERVRLTGEFADLL